MKHDTFATQSPCATLIGRYGSNGLQIAKLRRAFGLTLQQAALVAALLYGEGTV